PPGIPRADRFEHGTVRKVEEARRLMERIGMRASHEAVTNEADVERFHFFTAVGPPPHGFPGSRYPRACSGGAVRFQFSSASPLSSRIRARYARACSGATARF